MQLELTIKSEKIARVVLQRGGSLVLSNALELRAACTLLRAFVTARFVFKGKGQALDFRIISEVGWLDSNGERVVCKIAEGERHALAYERALSGASRLFADDRPSLEYAVASYLEKGELALGKTIGLSGQLLSVKREGNALHLRTCRAPRVFEAHPAPALYSDGRRRLGGIRWDCAAVQAAGGVIAFIAPCRDGFVSGTYRKGRVAMTFDVGVAHFPSNVCDAQALRALFEQVLCLNEANDADR